MSPSFPKTSAHARTPPPTSSPATGEGEAGPSEVSLLEPDPTLGPVIEIDEELLEAVLASAERIGHRPPHSSAAPPGDLPDPPAADPSPHRPGPPEAGPVPALDESAVVVLPDELVEAIEGNAGIEKERTARIAAEAQAATLLKTLRDLEADKARLEQALHVLRARLEVRESDLIASRRRFLRENESTRQQASDHVLREVLPVLDTLCIAVTQSEADPCTVLEGVQMVLRQFHRLLDGMGVTPIQAGAGTPFDPAVHEAVMQIAHDTIPAGTVAEEIRPGWRVADRLLRAARVAVVQQPRVPEAPTDAAADVEPRAPAGDAAASEPKVGE